MTAFRWPAARPPRLPAAHQVLAAAHPLTLAASASDSSHPHRLRLLIGVLVVIALAGVIGYLWQRHRRHRRSSGGAGRPPVPPDSPRPDSPRTDGVLYRMGGWSARHRAVVLLAWIAILAGAVLGDHLLGAVYSDNFALPGTSAQQGADLLQAHRPSAGGQSGYLVFTSSGSLASRRAPIEQAMTGIRALPDVLAASDPFRTGSVAANGRTAYATVHFSVNPQSLGPGYLTKVSTALTPARHAGVTVNYGGQLGDAAKLKSKDARSELIGILAALVILLIGFGSVYGAGLPVLSALAGAFAGLSVLGILAAATTFPTVSPTLAIMMGLGVGIDYALFLSTRHRQLVIDGLSPAEAAARSLATSGRAVLVAALTVIIAMLGLYASGLTFVGKLGLAAAVTVAVAALSAITVVPVLLTLAGARIDRLRVRQPVAEASGEHAGWQRYAARLGAHPWRYLCAGVAVLAILAIPAFSMRLGHIDAGADPAGSTARQAYDELSAGFGPGANGPLTIVARLGPQVTTAAERQQLELRLQAALARTPDVARVARLTATPDGALLYGTVVPRTGPQDAATAQLMQTLQDTTLPGVLHGTGSTGYVTGSLAGQLQFRNVVASRLPYIIGTVIAAAFVLLLLAFRSPILALKAGLLNLLSIGASYGVIVAVFQWGWGSSAFGVSEKVPIESYVPMMIFAIVFGLSMDYEVFLLSRIREAWLASGDNRRSVAAGLASTGRVITCAALIMASVFAAFLLSTSVIVKMLALGLGLSVLIDASVIRLLVVPAAMFLLGRFNWWTPRWLDRILPGGQRRQIVLPEMSSAASEAR